MHFGQGLHNCQSVSLSVEPHLQLKRLVKVDPESKEVLFGTCCSILELQQTCVPVLHINSIGRGAHMASSAFVLHGDEEPVRAKSITKTAFSVINGSAEKYKSRSLKPAAGVELAAADE